MATGDFPPAARCCCNQHFASATTSPFGASHIVTVCGRCFKPKRGNWNPADWGCECPPENETKASPGMIEHVQRAVDDYVAGLGEVEDDAATVVELIQRGDSWHVSISAGAMHYENAESSLPAALEAVGRVLGESAKARRYQLDLDIDTSEAMAKLATLEAAAERVAEQQRAAGQSVGSCAEVPTAPAWKLRIAEREMIRAELLASLPPVQIADPEALAKLTPARVRAYLKGKGWSSEARPSIAPRLLVQWRSPSGGSCGLLLDNRVTSFTPDYAELILSAVADVESRSAAAAYLDILQTEPEA